MKIKFIPLIFLVLINYGCSKKFEKMHSQVQPIIWGCDDVKARDKLSDFSNGIKEPHPLDIGRYLFYTTYKFKITNDIMYKEMSMGYLDLIKKLFKDPKYFNNSTFLYNFDHDNLKAGWWSGMANASIILGLTSADEVYGTNNEDIVKLLIKNLSTGFKDGGSLDIMDEESYWIFEYAWEGMEGKTLKSVLNGFMFTLVCLETSHQIKANPTLHQLYQKGLNGLKKSIGQYYFDNYKWTKYSLIPSIEAPHYSIFVLMLLDSLSLISDESWIKENLTHRREILKQTYKIDLSIVEGDYRFLFSLVGPPHPYWIDIYFIEIELYFADGTTKKKSSYPPKDFSIDISKRGFVDFKLSKQEFDNLVSLTLTANYSNEKQIIYTIKKEELNTVNVESFSPKEVPSKVGANYDAKLDNDLINIIPESKYDTLKEDYRNNIGQVLFTPLENQQLNENEHLALMVENDFDVTSNVVFLYTEEGNVYKRTYLPMPEGKNIIILNPVGFIKANRLKNIAG